MNEDAVRMVMGRLGIQALHTSSKGWINAACPMAPYTHKSGTDRHPGFAIQICDDGVSHYACRACHYKGRVSELVRTLSRFRDEEYPGLAWECDLADVAGVFGGGFEGNAVKDGSGYGDPTPVDESLIRGVYPAASATPEAIEYMEGRGISATTCDLLGLVYDPDECRVLFPCRGRNGELYGFSGRTILRENQYLYQGYPKVRDYLGLPKASLMLGQHLVRPGLPSFVVEGLMGYAHLVEIGARDFCNPMAMMGSEMTMPKVQILSDIFAPVYLMTDPDPAGEMCLWGKIDTRTNDYDNDGAVTRLRKEGLALMIPEWPEGKIDPDCLTLSEVRHILDHCPVWAPAK